MTPAPGSVPRTDETVPVADSSVGELMSHVLKDLTVLVRQEVELAKAEVKAEAGKAAKGAGMLGGAGFAGYMVMLFLSLALWRGLATVLDQGWAALIVAALWVVVGVVLYSAGRTALRRVSPKPEQTAATLQQVPGALKGERP